MKILLYIVFSSSYLYESLKALNIQGLKYAFKPRFVFPRLCTRKIHCFKAGVCKIWLSGHIWPTAHFLKFCWNTASAIHLPITDGYSVQQQQSQVVAKETIWPESRKYLIPGLSQKKSADLVVSHHFIPGTVLHHKLVMTALKFKSHRPRHKSWLHHFVVM